MLQLRVSMRYLKDVLQMQFPQMRARAAAAEAEARARQVWMQLSLILVSLLPHGCHAPRVVISGCPILSVKRRWGTQLHAEVRWAGSEDGPIACRTGLKMF